jgi:hypothetical protein
MSAYNPPTYYFSGIGFNSSFYTVTTTGITQAQANALYLQKTTPDTATAVETFSSGILTTSVDVPTSSSNMNIATGSSSGTINIGTANVRTGIIHIGDGNNLSAGANIHINNGTSNASNTNIMNGGTTSGACNIMTGTTSSGIVNIATSSGSSSVNIATGTTTGIVSIGNSANSVTFGSPLNLFYTPSLITQTIQLGYTTLGSTTGLPTSTTAGTYNNFSKIVLPIVGVWILNGNMQFIAPSTNIQLSISNTTTSPTVGNFDSNCASIVLAPAYGTTNVSRVTSSSSLTWYLVATSGAGTNVQNVYFTATRIA